MWRGLTQLPSLITACLDVLQTANWHQEQSLLLQQETNQLLRELIVKVTTQKVETPEAEKLPLPSSTTSAPRNEPAWPARELPVPASVSQKRPHVLTEHDIRRNSRSTIAEEQFTEKAKALYPHRQGEVLPSPPTRMSPTGPVPPAGPSMRPLGSLP